MIFKQIYEKIKVKNKKKKYKKYTNSRGKGRTYTQTLHFIQRKVKRDVFLFKSNALC